MYLNILYNKHNKIYNKGIKFKEWRRMTGKELLKYLIEREDTEIVIGTITRNFGENSETIVNPELYTPLDIQDDGENQYTILDEQNETIKRM